MANTFPWPSVPDPLGEALHLMRMSGSFYCRSEFSAPWGLTLPAFADSLMFHVVTDGSAWLEVAGAAPRRLNAGDFALLPHGAGHRLASAPGVAAPGLFELPRGSLSERYEVLRHGGGGAATTMVCGVVRFDHPAARRLVEVLPPLVAIDAAQLPHHEWLHSSLRFMTAEAQRLQPGGEEVVTRLADILVIQALRAWIAHDPAARGGWLGALQDRQIGRAIALMHRDPAHPWTVASLAAAAAMSRSAFAARFTQLVGMPALQYLTRWRMQLAETRLAEHGDTLAALADRVGYQSEAAFSRAFKRHTGRSPGALKRDARGHVD